MPERPPIKNKKEAEEHVSRSLNTIYALFDAKRIEYFINENAIDKMVEGSLLTIARTITSIMDLVQQLLETSNLPEE